MNQVATKFVIVFQLRPIVSSTSLIKFVSTKSGAAKFQERLSKLVTELQQTEEFIELDVSQKTSLVRGKSDTDFSQFLAAVFNASSNEEKGKSLEALTAALFGSVPGFTVTQRVSTETEEIDLWILNRSEVVPFRDEGPLIIVECKNWAGKCGKNEFVTLRAKIENRKDRCTIGFLVSWNGFTETFTHEMLRGSREPSMIIPLRDTELVEAVENGNFAEILVSCWNRALMCRKVLITSATIQESLLSTSCSSLHRAPFAGTRRSGSKGQGRGPSQCICSRDPFFAHLPLILCDVELSPVSDKLSCAF